MTKPRSKRTPVWFKIINAAVDNPKLWALDPATFKFWFFLLCIAAPRDGELPSDDEIYFELHHRYHKRHIATHLHHLGVHRLVLTRVHDGVRCIHDWEHWQGQTAGAKRQKKYRESEKARRKAVTSDATRDGQTLDIRDSIDANASIARGANAPPLADASSPPPTPVNEEPKAKLFRIGKTILVGLGVSEARTGALIGMWLKQCGNDHATVLAVIEYAGKFVPADPISYVTATFAKRRTANGQRSLGDLCREMADEIRERQSLHRPPHAR